MFRKGFGPDKGDVLPIYRQVIGCSMVSNENGRASSGLGEVRSNPLCRMPI